jgi:hypothetical protein
VASPARFGCFATVKFVGNVLRIIELSHHAGTMCRWLTAMNPVIFVEKLYSIYVAKVLTLGQIIVLKHDFFRVRNLLNHPGCLQDRGKFGRDAPDIGEKLQ